MDSSAPRRPAARGRRGRIATAALAGAFGAAVWLVALPLVPETEHQVGPATLRSGLHLGGGTTVLVAPPLGTISADTHWGPLDLHVSLAELDVADVQRRISSGSAADPLEAELESALRSLAREVGLTALFAAGLVGALAGALVPRRTWRSITLAAVGAVVAAGISLTSSAATFDEEGFEEPKFSGALQSAPQVIRAVQRGTESLGELGSRYEALAERLSQLLALTSGPISSRDPGTVALLHVSDVHSNPLGVEFAGRLARSFDVDAVIDSGDLTSFGEPIESRVVQLVSRVGVPYFFVPGNHDSPSNRRAIASLDGVTLLDGQSVTFQGVEILGWADPTFTASNEVTTEEGNEERVREAAAVQDQVESSQPEVLVVHDERLAGSSFGAVPLVLAGHTHERRVDEVDGTVLLVTGSAGATGIGSFLVEAELPYEAQIVYLEGGRLVAVDYVTFAGLGTESRVERRLFPSPSEAEEGDQRVTPTS